MTAQKRASSSKKNAKSQKHQQPAPLGQQQSDILPPSSTINAVPASSSSTNSSQRSSIASSSPKNHLQNTTICIPIVYGSIAFFLDKKQSDEYHTHRWTLYVRGPNHEDLSVVISKVVFHLHPSFPQPVRELTEPPYEVTEKGWGEFEATIRIVWKVDFGERNTVLTHGLKLYPPGTMSLSSNSNTAGPPNNKEPVIHEYYDEVVFTNPTEHFFQEAQRWPILPKVKSKEEIIMEYFPQYEDDTDFQNLIAAQRFLEKEIFGVKERIMRSEGESVDVDSKLKEAAAVAPIAISGKGGGIGSAGGNVVKGITQSGSRRKDSTGGGGKKVKI